jgi:DNA repair exonuclease SbcCD ATPase subunit
LLNKHPNPDPGNPAEASSSAAIDGALLQKRMDREAHIESLEIQLGERSVELRDAIAKIANLEGSVERNEETIISLERQALRAEYTAETAEANREMIENKLSILENNLQSLQTRNGETITSLERRLIRAADTAKKAEADLREMENKLSISEHTLQSLRAQACSSGTVSNVDSELVSRHFEKLKIQALARLVKNKDLIDSLKRKGPGGFGEGAFEDVMDRMEYLWDNDRRECCDWLADLNMAESTLWILRDPSKRKRDVGA